MMNTHTHFKVRFALMVGLLVILGITPLTLIGQHTPTPRPALAQDGNCGIDLVLVLDSSGSIVPADFEIMKTFVADLVQSFRLGENDANISIVQFSDNARLEIGLSSDMNAILQAINNMVKIDQNTNITDGMEVGQQQLDAGRADVPKVMIVLTDGLHNTGPSPIIASANIRGEGTDTEGQTTILGVAVGNFQILELVLIAGGDYNVVQVPNFASLQQIKSILYDYSCAVVTGQRTNTLPTSEPHTVTTPQGTALPPPTQVATNVAPTNTTPTAVSQQPTPTIFIPTALGNTQLAFASDRDGDFEIYTINGDGTGLRQLTFNERDDNKPAWSPDGTKLAFESNVGGDYEIYSIDADGSNLTQITDNTFDDWGPDWSPDGTKIAYHSTADGDIEIFVMNADGSNPQQMTVNLIATDRSPSWSPDSTHLIYFSDVTSGRELYTVEIASKRITQLTDDRFYDGHPDWSPLGDQYTFSSTRVGANAEIFVMNTDGTNLRRLTSDAALDEDPSWSPDASQIAFESTRSGNYDIWIMNTDGTGLVQLTNDPANDWSVDWAWKP